MNVICELEIVWRSPKISAKTETVFVVISLHLSLSVFQSRQTAPTVQVQAMHQLLEPILEKRSSDKKDMKIIYKFGSYGDGPGQLNMPHGFCIGVNDNIAIADTNNHRISVFDMKGNYVLTFGEKGTNEGQLYLPRKVYFYPTFLKTTKGFFCYQF